MLDDARDVGEEEVVNTRIKGVRGRFDEGSSISRRRTKLDTINDVLVLRI